jgi:hypothetical protein
LTSTPSRIRDNVVDLADWVGKPAVLATTVVVAYLIGTLSIAATATVYGTSALVSKTRMRWLLPRYWINKQVRTALESAVESRLSEHYLDDEQFRTLLTDYVVKCRERATAKHDTLIGLVQRLPATSRLEQEAMDNEFVRWLLITALVDTYDYVDSATNDIGHLAYRLLGKEERVYDDYDRLQAEGTFRLGLLLPLGFLSIVLAYLGSPWWLMGLAVPVAFAYLGGASFAASKRGLAAAVSAGRVELPSLERIRTRDVKLEQYEDLIEDKPALPEPYAGQSRRRGVRP